MASCKECIHFDRCKGLYKFDRLQKAVSKGCSYFKDRSRFVEPPDYKYSAEERFRGAVQELIDIAKDSETPSKILQAASESLAHFACGLSKLEEIKQTLKEREIND